jgi:hypothetical protein
MGFFMYSINCLQNFVKIQYGIQMLQFEGQFLFLVIQNKA